MQYEFSFSGLLFGISLMVVIILIVKFHRKIGKSKVDTEEISQSEMTGYSASLRGGTTDNSCKKCNEVIQGNFCSLCGCPRLLEKIGWRFILNDIGDAFFVNRGLFYTIKRLLTKPGDAVKHYIWVERTQYIGPVKFLVICCIVFAVIYYFFHTENLDTTYYVNPFFNMDIKGWTIISSIIDWLKDNFAISGLISGFFMTLGVKMVFRNSERPEASSATTIYILLCYIGGIMVLGLSMATVIQRFTLVNVLHGFAFASFTYLVWAIGQFFDKKNVLSYVKAIISYFLGAFIFAGVIVLMGLLAEFIMKWI